MNLQYKELLPADFAPDSRAWIYQASRLFTLGEALALEEKLADFTTTWKSHGAPVKGAAFLFFGQFIVILADETSVGVGGCSTDSSVRVIKEIEQTYKVNLFDRTQLAFVFKEKVQLLPLPQFNYALENGFIDLNTLYFNNTVATKKELEENWIIPVKNSWLARKVTSN
jgi:hypothetical protein